MSAFLRVVSKLSIPVVLFFAAGLVHAQSGRCPPLPGLYKDYAAIRAVACEGNVAEVEKYFAKRQSDYEAGRIDDRELVTTYGAFGLPFPAEFFSAWLAQYPDSHSAHVAAGHNALNLGMEARGAKYASETTNAQFVAMEAHLASAVRFLERSIKLTARPIASYPELIVVGMMSGRRSCGRRGTDLTPNACVRAHLDTALQIDRGAYWVRRYYMDSLQPRWGGSFAAMEAFAKECQSADNPEWQRRRLYAMYWEERARMENRAEEKLNFALKAHELNPATMNLYEIVAALANMERHAEVIPYANEYLQFQPENAWALMRRGVALWQLNRNEEAFRDFLASANLGNAFSQQKVGYFLYLGLGVPQDRHLAIEWWEKAALNGDAVAAGNLREATGKIIDVPVPQDESRSKQQPWWAPVVQWTLWGVLMSLAMAWVGRSRLKSRAPADANVLVHPTSTLVIGVVGLLFFGAIAVVSNVFPNSSVTWWTTAAFMAFALLYVPIIADYFMARHEVSEGGLAYRSWRGRRGSLRWSDLRSVKYARVMKWFRLETRQGEVVRISAMLVGLPEFARLLLAQAPPSAIDLDTRAVLEETAAGKPPSVWN